MTFFLRMGRTKFRVLIEVFLIQMVVRHCDAMRVTRVRILRNDQDKMHYLSRSRYMRENLFFGMRPILYIQKYQNCDCGTSIGGGPPPSGSNTQLDPPAFPDDDIVPPSEPNAAIIISTTRGTTTTPSTVDHQGQDTKNDPDQDEEEEFELLLSNNGDEAHIVDEGYHPSPGGGSIRVGGGVGGSDGFPNDPFARPFLLTIRANPKNRRQNQQQFKGNNISNRSRRRRPLLQTHPNASRQVHGSLNHGSGHLSQMAGGGQFIVHSQQGASMFNGASDAASFVPLSAFIIPQNHMSPAQLHQQSLFDQKQQQMYQQQQQANYQRQLQLSNQKDQMNQPSLNPGFGHININTNERKQG